MNKYVYLVSYWNLKSKELNTFIVHDKKKIKDINDLQDIFSNRVITGYKLLRSRRYY
jgi:hypothetical protein